jgi:multiple sugar transport system substrate-binding protein
MKVFSMIFASIMLTINAEAKTIQLTLQHMEQPPSRVEAMQVVVDKFNAKYPQYRMKQNVVGWGEAYSRVTAQVEAGVGVDLQQAIPAFFTAIRRTVLFWEDEKFLLLQNAFCCTSGVPTFRKLE